MTIDIIKDEWRPVTPEPVKVERERRVYDEDPQRMVEAMAFKKEARVATTTGMGNQVRNAIALNRRMSEHPVHIGATSGRTARSDLFTLPPLSSGPEVETIVV